VITCNVTDALDERWISASTASIRRLHMSGWLTSNAVDQNRISSTVLIRDGTHTTVDTMDTSLFPASATNLVCSDKFIMCA